MKSLFEISKKLENKEISSLELTQESIAMSEKNEHNAYISVLAQRALKQAKASDERISSGKRIGHLDGVPFSLKDLFITKGIRSTGGSKILYNYIPQYEGSVSGFLQGAGGVLVGKVGCDEFGMGSTNEKTAFGAVTNPFDINKVAGGSSGGSAASVAEGSVFYSIGTDTGGSVRLPANFCGLVGYKPSYGVVTRYGQMAYGSSLDQASPMAADVMSIGCIMEYLAQADANDSTQVQSGLSVMNELATVKADMKGVKIGVDPSFIEACEPAVKKALHEAIDQFKHQGAEIVEVGLPHLKYSVSVYYILATAEASANLSRYDGIHYGLRKEADQLIQTYTQSRSTGFGDEVKKRIILGSFALSSGYQDEYFAKASRVRRLIADDFKKAYESCDFIFSPVCATTAFKLGEGIADPVKMYMNDLYTIPVNLSGLCSIAMPYGKDENSMPTGFQLIGKAFDDKNLLKAARSFELGGGER